MAPIELTIQSRSGKELCKLQLDSHDKVVELKKKFHGVKRAMYVSRQRFTLPLKEGEKRATALDDERTLASYGLTNGSVLQFKDLGPQIGYSTVFFWEYFGPMVVYPLFYLFPQYAYPGMKHSGAHAQVQTLACAYWVFHYAKRIVETFTVHNFGHATMPIFNLFKNCAYYWGFAAFVAYFVNHPAYTAPAEMQSLVALGLAFLCQLSNLRCHIILANLRKPGEKAYKIPRGFLFDYITCANYTAEIYGWVLFGVATQTVAAFLFIAAGAGQMAVWALAKHKRLLRQFDGKEGREKYPRRWIMLPPFY